MNWTKINRIMISIMAGAALLLSSCAPAVEQSTLTPAPFVVSDSPAFTALPTPEPMLAQPLDLSSSLQAMASESKTLSIPTTFAITRPDKELRTSYANYFITGTSNPDAAVYFGSNEIQRLGTKGTFGVYVSLAMGTNTFTFSQGDKTQTVTIIRTAEPGIGPITELKQDTIVPAVMSGVKVGGELKVGCTAPAGASVKASFGGKSVTLTQTSVGTSAGMPVNFAGTIPVDAGNYNADETQEAGKVSYEMSFDGVTKSFRSTGSVYVAGENSSIAVEVTSYAGFVYGDITRLDNFKEKLKSGARDFIKGQDNEYFELSSGGFIPKSMVRVVEGNVSVKNKLGSTSTNMKNKSEAYTFSGTNNPAYRTRVADNTFFLTLYNTSGTPKVDVSSSRLASSAKISEGESSVEYQFPLKGRVWGYDVSFDGDDTILTFKYKPTLSSNSDTPFEGLTILLDPGHGGTDSGAFGLAGKTGPDEADVNLANAQATKALLTSMGATVYMTRDGDDYLSLDDRLKAFVNAKADFFISMHHNSLPENVDANKTSGMEIYYHTSLSKSSANSMMSSLSSGLNRNNRSVFQSYYRVTLLPYAPSMLLELGFMSNPVEYEKAVSASEMNKVAEAIVAGIKKSLQPTTTAK